jgi:hypothetical protein
VEVKDRKSQSEYGWTKINIDENLKILQIEENDWSYPWYMVKHKGGFENTLVESITQKIPQE